MNLRRRPLWRSERRLWFRKTRLPVYLIILILIITIQWFTIYRPKLTNESQGSFTKYRYIISKTHRLRYQMKMLSFKFVIREHLKTVTIHEDNHNTEITKRPIRVADDTNWPIVISVGCSNENLMYFLESFREALMDSKSTVMCIFVLGCTESSCTQQETMKMMIDEFEGCFNKMIWNISESFSNFDFGRHPRIEQLQKSKLRWWNFVNKIFQDAIEQGVLFNGILKDFTQDILFVDSNVLLSPDFLQIATYASKMKSSLPGIVQLSLGIWGGHNLINAHPDTFAIRQSREMNALVYGMNQSNWKTLLRLQRGFLEDLNPDWTLSVGDTLSKDSEGFGIQTIVPTLSRYWLITSSNVPQLQQNTGHVIDSESSLARSSFPPWLLSPRLININSSIVNDGVRDSLGFLCNKEHTLNDGLAANTICYCSFWRWKNTPSPSFPRCLPQGRDNCLDSY